MRRGVNRRTSVLFLRRNRSSPILRTALASKQVKPSVEVHRCPRTPPRSIPRRSVLACTRLRSNGRSVVRHTTESPLSSNGELPFPGVTFQNTSVETGQAQRSPYFNRGRFKTLASKRVKPNGLRRSQPTPAFVRASTNGYRSSVLPRTAVTRTLDVARDGYGRLERAPRILYGELLFPEVTFQNTNVKTGQAQRRSRGR